MTLAGGDPQSLTLRNFLDAAYALLIEEYTRQQVPLLDAIQQTEHMRARGPAREESPRRTPAQAGPPPSLMAQLERWNQA